MKPATARLWAGQSRHPGNRERLFRAVRDAVGGEKALYPGSYIDIAASFAYPSVTYVDIDRRTPGFFLDVVGIKEIIESEGGTPESEIRFIHADYRDELDLEPETFDLLISLYAGPVSAYCAKYLKMGGSLLANPSHGDVALASMDNRFELAGVVTSRTGDYRISTKDLHTYLIPKKPVEMSAEVIKERQRGIGYTRSPFAYLFRRIG